MVNPEAPLGTVLPSASVRTMMSRVFSPTFTLPTMLLRILFMSTLLAISTAASAGTILVFGDSLSAGYGLPQDKGWVRLLETRLRDQRFDYSVANASISGETTGGGARRITDALKQHQPDIVVIELGANDGLRGQS